MEKEVNILCELNGKEYSGKIYPNLYGESRDPYYDFARDIFRENVKIGSADIAVYIFPEKSNFRKTFYKKYSFSKEENINKNIESYQKTSSYKRLLEKYNLDEYGIWEVFGEDPNCDFGGYHHTPSLKFLEGKLCDVIRVGVNLPRFWGWGGGGDFRKISVEKV